MVTFFLFGGGNQEEQMFSWVMSTAGSARRLSNMGKLSFPDMLSNFYSTEGLFLWAPEWQGFTTFHIYKKTNWKLSKTGSTVTGNLLYFCSVRRTLYSKTIVIIIKLQSDVINFTKWKSNWCEHFLKTIYEPVLKFKTLMVQ